MKKKYRFIIMAVLFLLGLGILLYPAISNFLANQQHTVEAKKYDERMETLSDGEIETLLKKAEEYNDNLLGDPLHDPFIPGSGKALPENYKEVLNVDGMMGRIEIPKIRVNLPIYHGTGDEALERGVGHIESTGLPIGGEGNHPVLTGHTGLPKAKLFTDLVELTEGDAFILHILDRKLYYTVDQIKVIEPENLSDLVPIEGMDCVTLLTCTPYGVNSHRLLVRGVRSYQASEVIPIQQLVWGLDIKTILFYVCAVLAGLSLLGWVVTVYRNHRKGGRS